MQRAEQWAAAMAAAVKRGEAALSRVRPMSKRTITRLFVGGILAVGVGIVLALAAVWAAFASDLVVTVTLVVVASLAALAGVVAAVASWVGALLNTVRLEDKTWFVSLLVLGLVGVGVLAMAAYVVAGPDGTSPGTAAGGMPPALTRQGTEVQ